MLVKTNGKAFNQSPVGVIGCNVRWNLLRPVGLDDEEEEEDKGDDDNANDDEEGE